MVKKSKWFKGNYFAFPADKMHRHIEKYNPIKKGFRIIPMSAVRTKTVKGKTYSQFYEKPWEHNEWL